MGVLPLRTFGDPVLREKSFPVTEINDELKMLVKDLEDTLHDLEGVGLAAPQIGVLKQVFVVDLGEGPVAYINTEIIAKEEELQEDEGCLSVPPVRVSVKRYKKIKVKALNIDGKEEVFEAEGLLAKAIQHEVDHINGMLVIDRLDKEERSKALSELREVDLFLNKADDSTS